MYSALNVAYYIT